MRVCGGGRSLVGEGRIARVGHCQIRLDLNRKRERKRSKRPKTGRKKVDAIGTIAAMNILRVGQIQGGRFWQWSEWIDC